MQGSPCPSCSQGTLQEGPKRKTSREVAGITFSALLDSFQCASCGEVFGTSAIYDRFELAIARELAKNGVQSPAALRWMRKKLGLTHAALGELLGLPTETVVAWEDEVIPRPSTAQPGSRSLAW